MLTIRSERYFEVLMSNHRRLLIGRTFFGLGDWIMMATVLKEINRQRPWVDIDLYCQSGAPRELLLWPSICGVRLSLVSDWNPHRYDWSIQHLVYPNLRPANDQHLIDGMIGELNRQCPWLDLGVCWSPAKPMIDSKAMTPTAPYCCLAPIGSFRAGRTRSSAPKEWDGWGQLGAKLSSAGYIVVQVGDSRSSTADLSCATVKYIGRPLEQVCGILKDAEFSVLIENGLSHLAGHVGARCFTLYTSPVHARPPHTWYPGQTPVHNEQGLTVDEVYGAISKTPIFRNFKQPGPIQVL